MPKKSARSATAQRKSEPTTVAPSEISRENTLVEADSEVPVERDLSTELTDAVVPNSPPAADLVKIRSPSLSGRSKRKVMMTSDAVEAGEDSVSSYLVDTDEEPFHIWEERMATFTVVPNRTRNPFAAAETLPKLDSILPSTIRTFVSTMERMMTVGSATHWWSYVDKSVRSSLDMYLRAYRVPHTDKLTEWRNTTICGILRHYCKDAFASKAVERKSYAARFQAVKLDFVGEDITNILVWLQSLANLHDEWVTDGNGEVDPRELQNHIKICIRNIGDVKDNDTRCPRMTFLRYCVGAKVPLAPCPSYVAAMQMCKDYGGCAKESPASWTTFKAFMASAYAAAHQLRFENETSYQNGWSLASDYRFNKRAMLQRTEQSFPAANKRIEAGASTETSTRPKGQESKHHSSEAPNKHNDAKAKCNGCGWANHSYGECRFKGNPGFNLNASVPWSDSPQGRKYGSNVGLDRLKTHVVANIDAGRGPFENDPNQSQSRGVRKRKSSGTMMALSEVKSIDNSVWHAVTLSYKAFSMKTTCLFDSGALQGNYGNQELMDKLLRAGIHHEPCSEMVCSAFSQCVQCLGKFNCFVSILTNNEFKTFPISIKILPYLQIPLILGRPTLLTNKLIHIVTCDPAVLKESAEPGDLELLATLQARARSNSRLSPSSDQRGVVSLGKNSLSKTSLEPARVSKDTIFDSAMVESDALFDSDEEEPDSIQPGGDPLDLIKFEGTPSLIAKARALAEEFRDIFKLELNSQPALVPPMKLVVDHAKWRVKRNRLPARTITQQKGIVMKRYIDEMLEHNIVQPSIATEFSQVLMVPKKEPGDWRIVHDYRALNEATEGIHWPLPNIKEMLVRIGSHTPRFFAVMDLTKGYNQFPMAADSKILTAFITFFGIFEYNRVAMGLKGAGAYFQQTLVSTVLMGLVLVICEVYLDDIITYGQSEDELLNRLRQIWMRMRTKRITISPKKTVIGLSQIEYVGHVINSEGTTFSKEKIAKVLQVPPPKTAKQLKSFLGLANYFRDHVAKYAELIQPLAVLLRSYVPTRTLKWSKPQEDAFENIKIAINDLPTLFFLANGAGDIHLYTDASNYAIGAYLCQIIDKQEKPIAFMSQLLSAREVLQWSVPEKECFAIVTAFKKFAYLIRDSKFTLHTDHKNLIFLKCGEGRVYRWKLFIQEYNFDIQFVEGPKNIVADAFSRTIVQEEALTASIRAADDSVNRIEYLSILYQHSPATHAQREVICRYHNDVVGHSGYERTVQRLQNAQQKWRYMRFHVKTFIEQCAICQKLSYIKPYIHVPKYTLASYKPMERLAMDTIGPLTTDAYGNSYVLVVICLFSRFVELYPIPSVEAKEAARALLKHFGRYGVPCAITSDRGSQFVNDTIARFLQLVGSEHTLSVAYSHEENGIVERSNRTIMNALRPIILHRRMQSLWSDALPLVQRIFNASVNDSTGYTPTQIIFGNAVNTDRGLFATGETSQHAELFNMPEWVAKMHEAQNTIIELATAHQIETDTKHLNADSQQTPFTEFAIGDFVLVNYPENAVSGRRPPNKLMAQLKGPYKVVNSTGSAIAIQNLVTNKVETVHISQLRPFHYDAAATDPRQVANIDSAVWDVEKIIAHRGNFSGNRANWQFRVRWQGYPPEQDTWEPWDALRNTDAMHIYLRSRNKTHLIPKSILQQTDINKTIVNPLT